MLGCENNIRQINPRVAFVFLLHSSFDFLPFSPLTLRLIYRHIVLLQKSGLNAILHTGPRWLFQNRCLFLARRHEYELADGVGEIIYGRNSLSLSSNCRIGCVA